MSLKIVGDGPDSARLAAGSRDMENVDFLGRVSRVELDDLLRRASILVFPSLWYEGTPRTIAEAFAAGTPVVASDLGAMSSMVDSGVTGLKFTPGDPADLVQKVERIKNDPSLSRELRAGARKRFEETYTAECHYEGLLEIYRKAIHSS